MRSHPIISAALAVAATACASSSQAEQVRDAHNERIDERTVAQTQAVEDREDARIDRIKWKHELAKNDVVMYGKQDPQAAKQLILVDEQQSTYEAKVAARYETIGVRINAAREKLAILGNKAPAGLRNELAAVQREHTQLEPEVRALPAAPTTIWEESAETLDNRLAALNARVKRLTVEIENHAV